MSERWSAGTFLTNAQELARCLAVWHIDDPRLDRRCVSPRSEQSQTILRVTFHDLVADAIPNQGSRPPYPQPRQNSDLCENDDSSGCKPDTPVRVKDRRVTLWQMVEFSIMLQVAPDHPALNNLKEIFERLLSLNAWCVHEPVDQAASDLGDLGESNPEDSQFVSGVEIPSKLLEGITEAAHHFASSVPPTWGADRPPLPHHVAILENAEDLQRRIDAEALRRQGEANLRQRCLEALEMTGAITRAYYEGHDRYVVPSDWNPYSFFPRICQSFLEIARRLREAGLESRFRSANREEVSRIPTTGATFPDTAKLAFSWAWHLAERAFNGTLTESDLSQCWEKSVLRGSIGFTEVVFRWVLKLQRSEHLPELESEPELKGSSIVEAAAHDENTSISGGVPTPVSPHAVIEPCLESGRVSVMRQAQVEYAGTRNGIWLVALPGDFRINRCEENDEHLGDVRDGTVLLPFCGIHVFGSVRSGPDLRWSFICISVSSQGDEMKRFAEFSQTAGALLVANPPVWWPLQKATDSGTMWLAALLFRAPGAAEMVTIREGGTRLLFNPWAASLIALRQWNELVVSPSQPVNADQDAGESSGGNTDGPVAPDRFQWKGETAEGLTAFQFKLLTALSELSQIFGCSNSHISP